MYANWSSSKNSWNSHRFFFSFEVPAQHLKFKLLVMYQRPVINACKVQGNLKFLFHSTFSHPSEDHRFSILVLQYLSIFFREQKVSFWRIKSNDLSQRKLFAIENFMDERGIKGCCVVVTRKFLSIQIFDYFFRGFHLNLESSLFFDAYLSISY
jgi:hypothetical protein